MSAIVLFDLLLTLWMLADGVLSLSYPPSWYLGMKNIPLENSHRRKTFLRKIEEE